ncbi:MAG: HipA domain-containing protein [Fusobacterium gastrosuis]|nr:HipA domain-containing protein [Fusobacterium gastrosuis]
MEDENFIIDFTEIAKTSLSYRAYGGANGVKKGIYFNKEPYMLKISNRNKKNLYTSSIISEYVCSKIFSFLDIPTQEVILGTIQDNDKEKWCVACKDFKEKGEYLYEFLSIKNSFFKENSNGSGTELSEILETIKEQKFCNPEEVKERFWDMFIVDSYLGNFDRHNGNWGFLVNEETGKKRIAPIYDCGSCLFAAATDDDLQSFLIDKNKINERVFTFPTSAIKENGIKINYYNYLTQTNNPDCLKSLEKITKKIRTKENIINNFILNLPVSNVRKKFYITILKERKEKILEYAL